MSRRIIRQPDAAAPAALNFDASGSGRRVDHGSAASLDDLHQGANGFTAWAWLVRTSNGSNQTFISKRSSSTVGWSLLVDDAPGEGSLRSVFLRTTTHSDCTSVAGVVPINKPTFVAITFNDADATEAAMYAGTLSDAATEVTYSSNINGSGSFYSDATANLYAGNLQQGLIYPFRGLIGRYGIVNRKLTLNELRRIQFGTMRQARVQGTVLLCEPWRGHAKVIDQSGNGNDGTITSATYAPRLWTGVSFDEAEGWVSKGAASASGSFASTLAGATMAADGLVVNQGAFASTLDGVTMSASGTVGTAPSGTFASTLEGVTMAASGQIEVPGVFASTLAGVSMAAAGTVDNRGAFASTLDGVAMTASGTVAPNATGAFSSSLGGVSMSASGFVGTPPAFTGNFIQRRRTPRKVIRLP